VARARQDSLAGARADSIVRARTESTTRAARPLPAPKPPEDTAVVVLGTRAAGAVFYVDGVARGVLSRLRRLTVRAGSVRLAINAEGCTAWDSTLTLASGQVLSLGYRQPRCP